MDDSELREKMGDTDPFVYDTRLSQKGDPVYILRCHSPVDIHTDYTLMFLRFEGVMVGHLYKRAEPVMSRTFDISVYIIET